MKKYIFTLFVLQVFLFSSCSKEKEEYNKEYYAIDMDLSYYDCNNLENGKNQKAKVILLLGQSNASG